MGAKLTITHKILLCMLAVWATAGLVGTLTRLALRNVAYGDLLATVASLGLGHRRLYP